MTDFSSWLRLTIGKTLHHRHERGATMVEYAVMASLIAAVCAAIVQVLGTQVAELFGALIGKF